ncbi:helix-turn-helix domain-containing protein [Orbaceae bacterium ESL0727]|nr:helix-turn-helix domain-containing protein [Orbaceae bacterium ESL0727]
MSLREEMGLTQDDIASQIHIRTKVVADIEQGQLTNTPFVFVRGYIRAYAEIVGLPVDEYQPFLDELSKEHTTYQMRDYSHVSQNRKRGKWLLIITILIIASALGITAYCVWSENKSNFVEVSHYISPTPTERINS